MKHERSKKIIQDWLMDSKSRRQENNNHFRRNIEMYI